MKAIEDLRRYVDAHEGSATADRLNRLCQAVANEDKLALAELYALDWEAFELAIELLRDWRIGRYYLRDGSREDPQLNTAASESRQAVTSG